MFAKVSNKIKNSLLFFIAVLVILSGYIHLSRENTIYIQVMAGAGESIDIPIITYHSVLKDPQYKEDIVISPSLFREDLEYLTTNGYTCITISDLINYVENDVALPEKPIMLTFDGGYYNNYLYVYPILKEYNAKAVISVIGYLSEQYSQTKDSNAYYSCLTWEQIKEMKQSGFVEIQNHSYNLHNTFKVENLEADSFDEYEDLLYGDLKKFQTLIFDNTGISPQAFTYPFNASGTESVETIKSLGFKASLTSEEGMNKITHTPECLYSLKRFTRKSSMGSEYFFKDVLGLN